MFDTINKQPFFSEREGGDVKVAWYRDKKEQDHRLEIENDM